MSETLKYCFRSDCEVHDDKSAPRVIPDVFYMLFIDGLTEVGGPIAVLKDNELETHDTGI